MKRFLALLLPCLVCFAVSASARAQQTAAPQNTPQPTKAQTASAQQSDADAPASKEDVEAYLAVMHSKEMVTNMIAALSKPMQQMMHDTYLKNKDKLPPDFEERMNKQTDDLMRNMPIEEMLAAMVPSYQKHFTKEDMAALTAFYSSPTGQKILKELPAITADSIQNMMPIIQKYTNNIQQQLQQQVAQMLQQSSPQGAKNPAPTAN